MKCPKCGAENSSNMTLCGSCGLSLAEASISESKWTERPDSIENLLSKDALRMENTIKEQLTEKKGILMRHLALPMTIVFRSEVETASLRVNEEGNVSIEKGKTSNPMLLVEGDHSTICGLILSREPRISAPGAIKLTVNWGPLRGMKISIAEGQIMDHPLRSPYGFGRASSLTQRSPKSTRFGSTITSTPIKRRHFVLLTILWASFVVLTVVTYIRGFEGSRILNVIDFAFALVITILLSISLLIMLAVNASLRALVEKGV